MAAMAAAKVGAHRHDGGAHRGRAEGDDEAHHQQRDGRAAAGQRNARSYEYEFRYWLAGVTVVLEGEYPD